MDQGLSPGIPGATERPVGWLSGSCLLIRRAAFDQVGGFDERYFMYMEDVDLGDRLGRAGWLNVYVPSSEILHAKGHSTGRDPPASICGHITKAPTFICPIGIFLAGGVRRCDGL